MDKRSEGITIASLTGENGIIANANEAEIKTGDIYYIANGEIWSIEGKVNVGDLKEESLMVKAEFNGNKWYSYVAGDSVSASPSIEKTNTYKTVKGQLASSTGNFQEYKKRILLVDKFFSAIVVGSIMFIIIYFIKVKKV